jgi:hypothetical protein
MLVLPCNNNSRASQGKGEREIEGSGEDQNKNRKEAKAQCKYVVSTEEGFNLPRRESKKKSDC